jgi:hypothetical protein
MSNIERPTVAGNASCGGTHRAAHRVRSTAPGAGPRNGSREGKLP